MKTGGRTDPGYVDRWGAKKRGDLIEVFWEKALRAWFGPGVLHYAGRYQRTLIDPDSPLSATPDAVIAPPDAPCFVAECKTLDPRAAMERPRDEHVFQVQVQMGLVRQLTQYQPTHAVLCYIDASFLDESKEFEIPFDPEVFAHAKVRAREIMEARSAEELRPEGYIAGGAECQYCAYRQSCSAMRAGAVPANQEELDPQEAQVLADLCRARGVWQHRLAEADLAKRQIEASIKGMLQRNGTRRATAEGYSVSWAAIKGRPAWDWPALRAAAEEAGLDLAPFEKVGEPSDRLTVRLDSMPAQEAAE